MKTLALQNKQVGVLRRTFRARKKLINGPQALSIDFWAGAEYLHTPFDAH